MSLGSSDGGFIGFVATVVVAAASGFVASLGLAYRSGKKDATVEERVSALTTVKIEARLVALEAWTTSHDRAVQAILDRFDVNVDKIGERLDRLSERIDRLLVSRG